MTAMTWQAMAWTLLGVGGLIATGFTFGWLLGALITAALKPGRERRRVIRRRVRGELP